MSEKIRILGASKTEPGPQGSMGATSEGIGSKETAPAIPILSPATGVHAIDEARLDDWLARHLEGFGRGLDIRQFEGGQSNPTYLIESPKRRVVLRKKPPGMLLPTAHRIEREYRILSSLALTEVPVPAVLGLCEDDSVIGTAFYLMDYLDGRVFVDPRLPRVSVAERRALILAAAAGLAAIHSVDIEKAGLLDLVRPGDYLGRQLRRWTKQYEASRTDDIKIMDRLAEYLQDYYIEYLSGAPDSTTIFEKMRRASLVHGDYRLGNLLFALHEPRLIGVLDWELATVGDPLADLAYVCMAFHHDVPGYSMLESPGRAITGIPDEHEIIEHYLKGRGLEGAPSNETFEKTSMRIPHWNFYLAFSCFRFAAILQGVYRRGLDGNAASGESLSKREMVRTFAESGYRLCL
ncbi:phosphotransferase [Thioalkalivibrio sp. HK1]|uniref:phosphotransferase n=1 Tax=Thioalkalivibrio sp. HK1 TaxID=1469245 RepID=UPI00046EBCD6|nr:phosphotransferase [Thioalkalivibrio sp. HK1]